MKSHKNMADTKIRMSERQESAVKRALRSLMSTSWIMSHWLPYCAAICTSLAPEKEKLPDRAIISRMNPAVIPVEM